MFSSIVCHDHGDYLGSDFDCDSMNCVGWFMCMHFWHEQLLLTVPGVVNLTTVSVNFKWLICSCVVIFQLASLWLLDFLSFLWLSSGKGWSICCFKEVSSMFFMYRLYFDSSFLCTVHVCIYYMEKFSFELIGWSMMYFVLFNSKLRVSTVMCGTFLSEKKMMYTNFL